MKKQREEEEHDLRAGDEHQPNVRRFIRWRMDWREGGSKWRERKLEVYAVGRKLPEKPPDSQVKK